MIVGERRGVRLADFRHRVTVRSATKTIDSHRQQIIQWENELTDEPARFEQVGGGEIIRGRQVEAGVTAIFTVNYNALYDPEKQIVFDGVEYGIVRVYLQDGVKRFSELHCKANPLG